MSKFVPQNLIYGPETFSVITNPTLSDELERIRSMVLSEDFDINDGSNAVITPKGAHQLEYGVKSDRIGRGKCRCGRNKKNQKMRICKKTCGCIKNGQFCSSACGCSQDCPNRKA